MSRRQTTALQLRVSRGHGLLEVDMGWLRSTWATTVACFLALVAFTCLFFRPEIFQGMAMFPASTIPGDPRNIFLGDQFTQTLPWHAVTARAYRSGVAPQWNPFVGLGTPFLAAMQPGVFYPLNVFALLIPIANAAGARAALSLLLASTGMLLYLRRLGLCTTAALFGAIAFGYGPIQVAWTGTMIGAVVIWLPWLMYGVERMATEPSVLGLAFLAAILATTITGGHPESIFCVATLVSAYGVYRLAKLGATRHRALAMRRGGLFVASLLLGLALSAPQLVPSLAYLPTSATASLRAGSISTLWDQLTGSYTEMLSSVALLFPDFFGNPTRGPYWLFAPTYIDYNEAACYVGTGAAILILSGLWRRQAGGHAIFYLVAAGIYGGVAFGWPIVGGLRALPVIRSILPGRLRLEMTFCLACLAALAVQGARERPYLDVRRAVMAGVRRWSLLAIVPTALVTASLLSPGLLPDMRRAVDLRTLLPLGLAAGMMMLVATKRPSYPHWALAAALVGLEALDLYVTGASYNPAVPPNRVLPETATMQYLQARSHGFRVATIDPVPPNVAAAYGVEDAGDYDPALPNQLRSFYRMWLGRDPSDIIVLIQSDQAALNSSVTDLLSIKYIVAKGRLKALSAPRWRSMQSNGQYIYENTHVQPEATVVSAPECVASENLELAAVLSPAFDPRRSAAIVCSPAAPATDRAGDRSPGVVLSYGRGNVNSLAVHVRMGEPGYLVLSQEYVNGWTMNDGLHPIPIKRCDGILQCVFLPRGDWKLSATYAAPGLALGTGLAVAAAILLAGLAASRLVLGMRRHRVVAS